MADNSILPKASAPLVDQTGRPTRAFYTFFNALVSSLQGQINAISKLVKNLALVIAALGGDPDSGEGIPDIAGQIDAKADKSITITGMQSIQGGGDLSQNRFIYLDGDVDDVPGVSFYGSPDGNVKGWTAFSANFTPSMDADDNVTLDLADLSDSGTGTALLKITRDAKGRISGTSAATTTDLTEGSNLYFTNARADARITLQKGVALGLAPLGGDGKLSTDYLPAAVLGQVSYQGTWDASAGTPPTTTPEKGWYYIVTVAGSTDLDGITDWNVGDWAIYNGASWDKIDNTDAVVTVNGYTGAVTLTAADVGAATSAQGAKADSAVQSVVAGTNVTVDNTDPQNPIISATGGGGSGDVVGPASAVDGDVALFDGITGKLIKSGGALAAAVRGVVLAGLSTATSAAIAATDTVLQAFGKLQAQITDNLLPAGYIDGLKMVWVSGTALTVTSGAAYIPGSGKVLRATSDIAKTGLSLSASTWYHVYLYDNSGTPDVEIVTTAPATAYNGTARAKTGDTSRRYVGSIKTDSGGNIFSFYHGSATGSVHYRIDLNTTGFKIVSGGASTTDATVSASGVVPVTCRALLAFAENNVTGSATVLIGNSDGGSPLSTHILAFIRGLRTLYGEIQLTSAQSFTYVVAGGGIFDCYCAGYRYER